MWPALRHYVEVEVAPGSPIAQNCLSFLYLCEVLEEVDNLKKDAVRQDVSRYVTATRQYFRQHILAYGVVHFRPKLHGMFDLAIRIERDRFLLDCWALERKNLATKVCIDAVDCLSSFERTCLRRILTNTISMNLSFKDGLCEPTHDKHFDFLSSLLRDSRHIVVSSSCRCNGFSYSTGDLLAVGSKLYHIEACCSGDSVLYLLTLGLDFVCQVSRSCARVRESNELEVFMASDPNIAPALAWRRCERGCFEVLGVK